MNAEVLFRAALVVSIGAHLVGMAIHTSEASESRPILHEREQGTRGSACKPWQGRQSVARGVSPEMSSQWHDQAPSGA